jgi:hypothetical protein
MLRKTDQCDGRFVSYHLHYEVDSEVILDSQLVSILLKERGCLKERRSSPNVFHCLLPTEFSSKDSLALHKICW